MKHTKYPKIEQFRNIVTNINRLSTFVGLDENQEPIYDNTKPKPVLTFKGTVKLHGTNAGICYNDQDGLWAQSRENIITITKDNAGFVFFVNSRKDDLMDLINIVKDKNGIDTSELTISIYGEWAGSGIQKGVGISNIEKSFFIFGAKISKQNDPDFTSYWVNIDNLGCKGDKIYNIEDFPTYKIDIDFNMPQLKQNELGEITQKVEEQCPVAKQLGFEGVGEGVVWSTEYKGAIHRFKVKGEKHSVSKVKTLASVDVDKLNNIMEFVDYAITKNRFDQAIEKIFDSPENMDIKKMGDLIRWMVNDVNEEEIDTMVENGLEPKDVNKYISTKTREMFFKYYKF
jgi:hypothetical protein